MANTYTSLIYHVVFSTKDRRPIIKDTLQRDLYAFIGGIIRAEGGTMVEIGGIADHVHIVTKLKPGTALAALVRAIKAKSSKWAKEREPRLQFAWQRGYGAFTVSESRLEAVRSYVRNQEEHHRTRSFQDELIRLLARHGIAYDERFLWT
jgi:putative transposase